MKQHGTGEDELSHTLYLSFQRILRCLDFGRSLQGGVPTLTVTQMRVLSFFNEQETIHISEISRRLGMSLQSVNNIVSRLEAQGIVKRSQNREDRRLADIRLTLQGEAGLEMFRREQVDTLNVITQQLSAQEQAVLQAALDHVAAILEKAVGKSEKHTNV